MVRSPDTGVAVLVRAWSRRNKEAEMTHTTLMQTPVAASDRDETATIEVGLESRRDALSLMDALSPFHSFMVQHTRERWVVHAHAPGCHGEPLEDLVATIDHWSGGSEAS
jgi:hypothetical protein